MATASLIPLSEYLSTTYEPDCDYIEGELQERNFGERQHALLQALIATNFHTHWRSWNVIPAIALRLRIASDRYRVPDICVMRRSDPNDRIVQTPPLICIEVLSPEDRIQRMQERIDDYARMGVQHIWLIDPLSRKAWIATRDGSLQHVSEAFTIPGTPIRIPPAEVFAELDDMLTQLSS